MSTAIAAEDAAWAAPAGRDPSPRLTLRSSLIVAARAAAELARAGRDMMRRLAARGLPEARPEGAQPDGTPPDGTPPDGTPPGRKRGKAGPEAPLPDADRIARAFQLLRAVGPWIGALRDRLDEEARVTRDLLYLMLTLNRRRRRAPRDPAAPPMPAPPPNAAEEAERAKDRAWAKVGRVARSREERRAFNAEARMARAVADGMPVEAVVREIRAALVLAARLLGHTGAFAQIEAFARSRARARRLRASEPQDPRHGAQGAARGRPLARRARAGGGPRAHRGRPARGAPPPAAAGAGAALAPPSPAPSRSRSSDTSAGRGRVRVARRRPFPGECPDRNRSAWIRNPENTGM
ncbi:MAG: hypothetical protein JSR21_16160 [Proteobacteria bacterium]|nr:hypothetical protein [Pseudomonadota bacterium]